MTSSNSIVDTSTSSVCSSCGKTVADAIGFRFCPYCGFFPLQAQAPDILEPKKASLDLTIGNDFVGRDKITIFLQGLVAGWPLNDVPILSDTLALEASSKGKEEWPAIRLADRPDREDHHPSLYVEFRRTSEPLRYSKLYSRQRRWIFVQADMRPALNLRLQVGVSDNGEVDQMEDFFRGKEDNCRLFETYSDLGTSGSTDFLYLWREAGEIRFMISTRLDTGAGLSIHSRISGQALATLHGYLQGVGFLDRFPPSLLAS